MTYLADTDSGLGSGPCGAATCTYRIALRPGRGRKVLSLQTDPTRAGGAPLEEVRVMHAWAVIEAVEDSLVKRLNRVRQLMNGIHAAQGRVRPVRP